MDPEVSQPAKSDDDVEQQDSVADEPVPPQVAEEPVPPAEEDEEKEKEVEKVEQPPVVAEESAPPAAQVASEEKKTTPEKDVETGQSIMSDDEVKQSLLMEDESTPLQAQETSAKVNEYWKSKKSVSAEFRDNMGLALRGGVLVTCVGLPFLLSTDNHMLPEFWNDLRRQGLVNTFAVVMCIYTLYKSVGETVMFAWQGMAGTLACSTTIWLMFQIFPGGVTPDAPPHHLWCGIAIGLAFTILMLGLNVGLLAQIFGIANFTYFYMNFMLGQSSGFSSGWEINTKGAAVSSVMVSLVGVTLAILATLLPWPILLIRKAKTGADILTADTCDLWSRAVKLFCAEGSTHDYEKDTLVKLREGLQISAGTLGYNIDNAWWECLGMGPWQRSRKTLATYRSRIMENHDVLPSLLFACEHNDGGQSHSDLINPLKKHIEELVAHSQILYQKATVAAVAGGIVDEEEHNSMYDSVKKTEASIEDLTNAFHKTKKDLGLPLVNSDQMDEHAFCFDLCSNGRIACDLARDLIGLFKDKKTLNALETPGLFVAFDPSVVFSPGHLNFLMRNSITLITCFVIGYFGFPYPHANLVKPGSAGVACTGAILLSSFKPSMTKNLDRLQGVVLGSIVGQLVWFSLGWCTWWGYLGICIALFVWVTGSLYVYYNSAKYGIVGCLLAAFGTTFFVQGCSDGAANPAGAYFGIVECVVAIFVVIGVDAVTSGKRCSDMAHEAYLDFWQSIRSSVEGILDPNTHTPKADHAALLAKVQLCAMLNPEAIDEPRWWRTPWRKFAYADGIACATKLRLALKTMENSIPGQDDESSKDASSEDFDRMLALQSFSKIRDGVNGKFEQLERFLKVFKHETEGILEELENPGELRQWSAEVRAGIEEFMTEALAKQAFQDEDCPTLEDDNTCEISMFLSCVDDVMTAMRAFQHSILRHA